MISVRYSDLAPGMHAEAVREAGGTVVYLLPGLTSAQRKAALRRLRQEGSRGCGPYLPPAQLTAALTADRLRFGVQSSAGAVRHHPVGVLTSAVLVGGLLGGFVFASLYEQAQTASPGGGSGSAATWAVPDGARAPALASGGAHGPARPSATGPGRSAGLPNVPPGGAATTNALPKP